MDINHLLLQAAEIVTSSRDDPRRQSLLKMIACVLNKERSDSQITTFVNSVVHDFWTSKEDHDRRKESLELLSWVIFQFQRIFIDVSLLNHWCYGHMLVDTI